MTRLPEPFLITSISRMTWPTVSSICLSFPSMSTKVICSDHVEWTTSIFPIRVNPGFHLASVGHALFGRGRR